MDPIVTAHYGMMAAAQRFGDGARGSDALYLSCDATGGGPVAERSEERLVEAPVRERSGGSGA